MTAESQPLPDNVEHAHDAEHARTSTAEEQPIGTSHPVADNHRNASDEEHRRAERLHWRIGSVVSVVATAAALVAAAYAVGAYDAGVQTLAETRRQADAAREANEISRRTLAIAISASVNIGRVGFHTLVDVSKVPKVNITLPIGNDGGATTRGLTYSSVCAAFNTTPNDAFDYQNLAQSQFTILLWPQKKQSGHLFAPIPLRSGRA